MEAFYASVALGSVWRSFDMINSYTSRMNVDTKFVPRSVNISNGMVRWVKIFTMPQPQSSLTFLSVALPRGT